MAADELIKLRARVADVVRLGIVTGDADIYQATLISIWNDAERNRQLRVQEAQKLREQVVAAEAKAQAFASMSTIIYQVLDGYIKAAERAAEEVREQAAEREASLAPFQPPVEPPPVTETSSVEEPPVETPVQEPSDEASPPRRRRAKT